MPAKRPASFLLTPQYRVDVLWLTGTGPEVKTEAPPAAELPNETPAPFVDLHGLEGLLRKPDPKIVLSLPEDAELIDQLHKLTGKMPKFAQFTPPPPAPKPGQPAPKQSPPTALEEDSGRGDKGAKRTHYGSSRSNLRPASQTRGRRVASADPYAWF
jgi:hypothetical protein